MVQRADPAGSEDTSEKILAYVLRMLLIDFLDGKEVKQFLNCSGVWFYRRLVPILN